MVLLIYGKEEFIAKTLHMKILLHLMDCCLLTFNFFQEIHMKMPFDGIHYIVLKEKLMRRNLELGILCRLR